MKTESYWPQQQLYLFAICALFPEKISNKYLSAVEIDDYISYFFDSDEQLDVLRNLQSQNLLKVEVKKDYDAEHQFMISDIDQLKFRKLILEYLEKFRNDELIADYSEKPESFEELERRLYKYLGYTNRPFPIVNASNIWPAWSDWKSTISPFWEIALLSDLTKGDTRIIDIGISSVSSSSTSSRLPYVELEVLNKALLVHGEKEQSVSANTSIIRAQVNVMRISNNKSSVVISLDSEEQIILKDALKTDMAPYSLMHYLTNNRGKLVTLEYARAHLDGCDSVVNLSEQIRQSGFDKNLKDLFFEKTNKKSVQLKKEVDLTSAQIDLLKK